MSLLLRNICGLYSYGLYSYGPCNYSLRTYGLCSDGLSATAYKVMAHIVLARIGLACTVMAHIAALMLWGINEKMSLLLRNICLKFKSLKVDELFGLVKEKVTMERSVECLMRGFIEHSMDHSI